MQAPQHLKFDVGVLRVQTRRQRLTHMPFAQDIQHQHVVEHRPVLPQVVAGEVAGQRDIVGWVVSAAVNR
jgi:hypothetical protein